MTGDQWVKLAEVLAPALLAFLSLVGILVTAVLAYKTNKKVAAVETHQAEQAKVIDAAALIAVGTSKKSDDIIVKAEQIHTLANSNLSTIQSALDKLQAASGAEIKELRATIQRMQEDKKDAGVVADKLATQKAAPAAPAQPTQTLKLKEDVVIEGTLETKDGKEP